MIHWDVEQLSPAWFEARRGRLTASNFHRAMSHRSRETLLRDLNAEIEGTKEAQPFKGNAHTRRGHEHEDRAVAVIEMTRGIECRRVGYVEHNHHRIVMASPDRIVLTAEGAIVGPLEVKCPSLDNMASWMFGEIPFQHLDQVFCQVWCLQSIIPAISQGMIVAYNEQLPPRNQVIDQWLDLPARWVERAEETVEWFAARLGTFEMPMEEV